MWCIWCFGYLFFCSSLLLAGGCCRWCPHQVLTFYCPATSGFFSIWIVCVCNCVKWNLYWIIISIGISLTDADITQSYIQYRLDNLPQWYNKWVSIDHMVRAYRQYTDKQTQMVIIVKITYIGYSADTERSASQCKCMSLNSLQDRFFSLSHHFP